LERTPRLDISLAREQLALGTVLVKPGPLDLQLRGRAALQRGSLGR